MTDADLDGRARDVLGFSRWWLVAVAAAAMAVVSPYQYVWTALEGPVGARLDASEASVGLVFTIFVVVQAGSQVPVGWWRDRHGPRAVTAVAAVLAGGGYLGLAEAATVPQVYACYGVGALGVGVVYTVAVNTALKWFPDRPGLTSGACTMAFAAGSALAVPVVRASATPSAYPTVLRPMGLLIVVVVLLAALVLRDPPAGWRSSDGDGATAADGGTAATPRQVTPRELAGTGQFWLLYAMFVAVSGAGLLLTAKVVQVAVHYDLGSLGVTGLSASAATVAATLLPLAGGAGRLVLGAVSDRVERRTAMAAAFTACGLALFGLHVAGATGSRAGFLLAVVVATFCWSAQYALFPSLVAAYYGERHSSANYALLYSGKVWGGVFGGGVAGWLGATAGWPTTVAVGGGLALAAGVGALALRPPPR